MYSDLAPANLLEETRPAEITGASWRLRRCDAADAGLDLFDESTDKLRRSVERARASATSILHRGINQLRRLQNDRRKAAPPAPVLQTPQPQPQPLTKADLESLLEPPADFIANLDAMLTVRPATPLPAKWLRFVTPPSPPPRRPVKSRGRPPARNRSGLILAKMVREMRLPVSVAAGKTPRRCSVAPRNV